MHDRQEPRSSAVMAALLWLSCALLVGPIDAFLSAPALLRRPMVVGERASACFRPLQFGDNVALAVSHAPSCSTRVRPVHHVARFAVTCAGHTRHNALVCIAVDGGDPTHGGNHASEEGRWPPSRHPSA
jgi:hypothetical protein